MGPHPDDLREWTATDGDAVVVPAGTWHDLVSTGDVPLQVYPIYSPPEHPHGTVHPTRAQAMEAEAQEYQQ